MVNWISLTGILVMYAVIGFFWSAVLCLAFPHWWVLIIGYSIAAVMVLLGGAEALYRLG